MQRQNEGISVSKFGQSNYTYSGALEIDLCTVQGEKNKSCCEDFEGARSVETTFQIG